MLVTRFTKQHDRYSCGPTAIANALKWAGQRFSYRDNKKDICDTVACINPAGMRPSKIVHGLKRHSKKPLGVSRRNQFSLQEVDKHLLSDKGAIILRYYWPDLEQTGHYIFISELNTRLFGGMYYVTNLWSDGPAGRYITRNTLKWLMRKRQHAICWFLHKGSYENSR